VRCAAELSVQAHQLRVPNDALRLELAAIETYAIGASGRVEEAQTLIAEAVQIPAQANFAAAAHLRVNEIAFNVAEGRWDEKAVTHVRKLVEETDDPGARARLWFVEGLHSARTGDYAHAEALLRSVYDAMRGAANVFGPAEVYGNLSLFLAYGDSPVNEALARCMELREEASPTPLLHATVGCATALLLQFSGDTTGAEELLDQAEETYSEMGHVVGRAGLYEFRSEVLEISGSISSAAAAMGQAEIVYAGAGLHLAAARCRMRGFLLDPRSPAPQPGPVAPPSSWEARLLHHQMQAVQSDLLGDGNARAHLDAAVSVAAEVHGAGATFVPLLGCLRIAQRLADAAQARMISVRLNNAIASRRMACPMPD
jgi:hypothetical protein